MRRLHDHRSVIEIDRHVASTRAHTHRAALVHLYRRTIGQPQNGMRSARSPQFIAFFQLAPGASSRSPESVISDADPSIDCTSARTPGGICQYAL